MPIDLTLHFFAMNSSKILEKHFQYRYYDDFDPLFRRDIWFLVTNWVDEYKDGNDKTQNMLEHHFNQSMCVCCFQNQAYIH